MLWIGGCAPVSLTLLAGLAVADYDNCFARFADDEIVKSLVSVYSL